MKFNLLNQCHWHITELLHPQHEAFLSSTYTSQLSLLETNLKISLLRQTIFKHSAPHCQRNNESFYRKKVKLSKRNKLMDKMNVLLGKLSSWEMKQRSREERKSRQKSKNYKLLHSNNTLMDSGWKFFSVFHSLHLVKPPSNTWSMKHGAVFLPLWEIKMSTFWATENGKQIEPSSFWVCTAGSNKTS